MPSMLSALFTSWALFLAAPTDTQISGWVRDLGHVDLAVRNSASQELQQAGEAAADALFAAIASSDPEVVTRARELLKTLYGDNSKLPSVIARHFKELEQPHAEFRLASMRALMRAGHVGRLRWKMDQETDESRRREFDELYVATLPIDAAAKLESGRTDAALRVLEELHRRGNTEHLAAYLYLTGQAPASIERLKKIPQVSPPSPDNQLLWHLGRLTGQRDLTMAEAPSPHHQQALAWDAHDWKSLADRMSTPPSAIADALPRIAYWGHMLAIARGGNLSSLPEVEKQFIALKLAVDDESAKVLAEAWLLFGDAARAEEALRGRDRFKLAELLALRGRYREALTSMGIADPHGDLTQWYRSLGPATKYIKLNGTAHPMHAGLLAGKVLYQMGETQQAEQLFEQIVQAAPDDDSRDSVLESVVAMEMNLGVGDQAERHMVATFRGKRYDSLALSKSFARYSSDADSWYQSLSRKFPQKSVAELLHMTRQIVDAKYRPVMDDELWNSLTDISSIKVRLSASNLSEWCECFALARLERGQAERAVVAFLDAAPSDSPIHAIRLVRIADYLTRLNHIDEATDLYRRAAYASSSNGFNHWLYGATLVQLGKPEATHELELARLLPLGRSDARRQMGMEMLSRGNTAEARAEIELALRLEARKDGKVWPTGDRLAIAYTEINPAQSLNHWYAYIASSFERRPSGNQERLLHLGQQLHRAQIAEKWNSGKLDEALKLIQTAQALIPHDVEFTLAYMGKLTAANRAADATLLFQRADDAINAILADFPAAAHYHQQRAWLAARSFRNLEFAQKHADEALRADPESTAYLQTLAEVRFQRNQKSQAIELIKRCIAREPHNPRFQLQLQRFESASPGPVWNGD